MRIVNSGGRLGLVVDDDVLDVEMESAGAFSSDPQAVFDRWDEFRSWADEDAPFGRATPLTEPLGPPVPRPRQIFAIGLNYRQHATEVSLELPQSPMVFTKFSSAVYGPTGPIVLPGTSVDWEVELVVVIGRTAHHVNEVDAWDHIAGLTVGQDLSERQVQFGPPAPPQFNLGKSFPGFAPLGPCLVTPDELRDPDDLEIGCLINGEQVQKARTSDMVFSVPELVAFLSRVLTLHPGDVIFTGTPPGVGYARSPERFLVPGEELVSYVEGIGEMRHHFVVA